MGCVYEQQLNFTFHLLSQAVQAFVKQGMSYISQTPDLETKVELLKTLQSVTEGKVCPGCLGSQSKLVYRIFFQIATFPL